MARKYTILKVLTQNLNRSKYTSRGFTLIELIVGLLILSIVSGLALNAFVNASKDFSQDKKTIDSSQNLSAILEIIGNDIKQAGEQIGEDRFPAVKIEAASGAGYMTGSSIITIRRALTTTLAFCEAASLTNASVNTQLVVADNGLSDTRCNVGTTSSTTTPPVTRPTKLREARDYRCKLDDINADYSDTTKDYCLSGSAQEEVLAMVHDGAGNIRKFTYIDDTESSPAAQYTITTKVPFSNAFSTSTPSSTATYLTGSAIYLIEERVYSLDNNGNLQVERDASGTRETLIKGIDSFKVSARVYGDPSTRLPDPIDNPLTTLGTAPSVLPSSRRCDAAIPFYICAFNSTTVDRWKTLQGIKVELQAKYDPTGRAATASAADTDKLTARAEFFPRNVLSK